MASPTTPMHGKLAALYLLRPNGYESVSTTLGLNDVTWGTGSTAAATTVYKVTIDATVPSPDTFTWTVNGGGGAAGVAITGAAQLLADGQTITFGAVDGHTIGDSWTFCNLAVEPCTVVASAAQITAAANRLLNPNAPPTFTPTNAVQVLNINYTNGTATFSAAPGVTTATGKNGTVMEASLQKVGYLIDWTINITLDMADASRLGQQWKEALPGQAGMTGSANAYFIGTDALFHNLKSTLSSGAKFYLLELFNYDPDQDQTGDHILAWASFTSFNLGADIGSVVKESINFQVIGDISFVANV